MLVLTRRKDESIMIDGNIEIKIVRIADDKVRIGIDAPKNVSIHRKEIQEKIDNGNDHDKDKQKSTCTTESGTPETDR